MNETKKKIETIDDCVNEHGLQVSGMGVLMENSKKTVELLDKIQKFLFFTEKRQKEMFDWMQKNLNTH